MEQTVLIIDDSEDDVVLTQMVLRKIARQFKTESAPSGAEGLAILRSGMSLPAAILLDLKMPGMDGVEVLRAIRSDEHLRGIVVIVVTHSDLASDRESALKAGANSFLHKSVDLDHFARDIKLELERWVRM